MVETTKKSEKAQVLIVEDNPVILQVLTFALEKCGLKPSSWDAPEAALEYFQNHQDEIRLVVTDIDMPVFNGFELCSKMLEVNPELKFIFISGAPFCDRLDKGDYLERFPFLSKPFRISHFLEVLSGELNIDTITPIPTSPGS